MPWLGNLLVGVSGCGPDRTVLGLPMGWQTLLTELLLPFYTQLWVNKRMCTCERVVLLIWGGCVLRSSGCAGWMLSWIWLLSSEFYALAHGCCETDEHGPSEGFCKQPLAVSSTMPAAGAVVHVFRCSFEEMSTPCCLPWADLPAWVAWPGWQDQQAHVSHCCHPVNPRERLWPLNFAEAWLRRAMLRTKQLVLDARLPKEGFAFPVGFGQISGLNDGCCSLPQIIRSIDWHLCGLGSTPSLLSENCATPAWTTVCCLTSCRPFLSVVLDIEKPWRASAERLQVGHSAILPALCRSDWHKLKSHNLGFFAVTGMGAIFWTACYGFTASSDFSAHRSVDWRDLWLAMALSGYIVTNLPGWHFHSFSANTFRLHTTAVLKN